MSWRTWVFGLAGLALLCVSTQAYGQQLPSDPRPDRLTSEPLVANPALPALDARTRGVPGRARGTDMLREPSIPLGAPQSPVFAAPGLREYVREVLARNGGYRAAESRLSAAAQRIAPSGALPNPMLTVGAQAVPTSFDLAAEPMTQAPTFMLQQYFPFPGKQGALVGVARADSAVAGDMAGAVRSDLAAEAAHAYFDLAFARTALTVWQGRADLADQAVRVTQVRYQTGVAPQTDMLRAELRRAELDEQRHLLDAQLAGALARIDALRGGPRDSVPALTLVTRAGGPALPIGSDSLLPDTVLARRLGDQAPALRIAAGEAERADRRAHVFGIATRPDFTVSLQYGHRFAGRMPFVAAQLGLSLPVWAGRNQGPAAHAADFDAQAAHERRDDMLARLTGELRGGVAELTGLQARIAQTSDRILPLANAASASALQRYQVGGVEFSAVLDAQDEWFTDQLRLARLMADYGGARARLAALLGEEWYQ